MDKKTAKDIVSAIFSELSGRSGFDILDLEKEDAGDYRELHAKCSERVLAAAAGELGQRDYIWNPEEEG